MNEYRVARFYGPRRTNTVASYNVRQFYTRACFKAITRNLAIANIARQQGGSFSRRRKYMGHRWWQPLREA